MDANNDETQPNNKHQKTVTLSKSWKKETVHSTIYNGGKVVMCNGEGLNRNLLMKPVKEKENESNTNMEEENNEEKNDDKMKFLAALCSGDVALIDAERGVKVHTIRYGLDFDEMDVDVTDQNNSNKDDDEMDDIVNESVLSDPDAVMCFALSKTDSDLVTASRSGVLRHYDLTAIDKSTANTNRSFVLKRTIGRAHKLPIRCMEFYDPGCNDGTTFGLSTFLATGSIDGQVKIWDMQRGYTTHAFHFSKGISCLSWMKTTSRMLDFALVLAVGCDDGTVRVFDLKAGGSNQAGKVNTAVLLDVKDHSNAPVTCIRWPQLSFGNGGEFLVTAGRDEVIHVYKTGGDEGNRKPSKRRKAVKGRGVYRRVKTLPVYEQIEGLEFTRASTNEDVAVFATVGSKGIVKKYNMAVTSSTVDIKVILSQPNRFQFGSHRGGYLLLHPCKAENHHLIAVDAEHNLSFLNQETLETERFMIGENDDIIDLKYIPEIQNKSSLEVTYTEPRIVVATNSSQVRVFNSSNFSCVSVLSNEHKDIVLSVDVSPCGRFVATCGKDKVMNLWSTDNARYVYSFHMDHKV